MPDRRVRSKLKVRGAEKAVEIEAKWSNERRQELSHFSYAQCGSIFD